MKFLNTVTSALPAAVFGFLALGIASTTSQAQTTTQTATFLVSATVEGTCTITATPLAFGIYTGTQLQNTSTVSVNCTGGTTYSVGLNGGLTGTVTARKMTGQFTNGNSLAYTLTSVGYAGTNWGNTSPTWVTGTGSGIAQPLTVYGTIAAGTPPPADAYTDTITATVTY